MSTTKIRLLAVEDSGYMLMALRAMIKLDPGIEIVGEARNGAEGVAMALDLKPDVITMDINMPGLNGIEATRQIMVGRPTPIITLSSMTERGKAATSQAIAAGAIDFIPKSMSAAEIDLATITRQVSQKIRFWGERGQYGTDLAPPVIASGTDLVVYAGGAGSPLVLGPLLQRLPKPLAAPVLVSVDTLPAAMTDPFLDHLTRVSGRVSRAAVHRGALEPGSITVIPGGRKARLDRHGENLVILLSAEPNPDLIASAARAALHPQFVFLSGDVRPLDGLLEIAIERPLIVAVQDASTCFDARLVDQVRQSSLPCETLSSLPAAAANPGAA
ncbi:response regulator [Lichenihabitans sp. Uapishka_5]|uniref:response regulator n=1 Tax=Lichenihabitans sp. Uapishka_5 TaxID=3037302 RepID=UPI0029E80897|nr:response regulator [Lichenihabitans sp. Uapishka_5]MDX7952359.1 response regulator [Lichenihabitans sp. Uapishka_5]